jgi:hypothetical protein
MNILPDLNIVLDYLITKRSGNLIAEKFFNFIDNRQYTIWIAASSVDNLQYILFGKAKKYKLDLYRIKKELTKYIQKVRIFSVSGNSIRESLKKEDLEDHIIYTNYKRIDPEGIVISNDEKFQKYPDVMSPEEFIKTYAHNKELSGIDGLILPSADNWHVYHQYTIRTSKRDELQAYLKDKGISTMVYYPVPLHKMRVFHGRMEIYNHLTNSENASKYVLSLPIEPMQGKETTELIIRGIRDFM